MSYIKVLLSKGTRNIILPIFAARAEKIHIFIIAAAAVCDEWLRSV